MHPHKTIYGQNSESAGPILLWNHKQVGRPSRADPPQGKECIQPSTCLKRQGGVLGRCLPIQRTIVDHTLQTDRLLPECGAVGQGNTVTWMPGATCIPASCLTHWPPQIWMGMSQLTPHIARGEHALAGQAGLNNGSRVSSL